MVELRGIIRDQNGIQGAGMGGDPQIVGTNRRSGDFQCIADIRVMMIEGRFQGDDRQNGKHFLRLSIQPGGIAFRKPEPNFSRDNQIDANCGFAHLANPVRNPTAGISDQVGNDVCIKKITEFHGGRSQARRVQREMPRVYVGKFVFQRPESAQSFQKSLPPNGFDDELISFPAKNHLLPLKLELLGNANSLIDPIAKQTRPAPTRDQRESWHMPEHMPVHPRVKFPSRPASNPHPESKDRVGPIPCQARLAQFVNRPDRLWTERRLHQG